MRTPTDYSECEELDDGDGLSSPDMDEICDGRDNDDDGLVDDGCDGVCDFPETAGTDRRVTSAGVSGYPAMVWSGAEYGITWFDDRDGNEEIYFARMNSSGEQIGSDLRLTIDNSDSVFPSIAWNGDGYGIAWGDERAGYGDIYFARVDPDGNKIGSDIPLNTETLWAANPSLVWSGSGYGVTWRGKTDPFVWEIFFARLDVAGNRVGPIVQVTHTSASEARGASLAWNGTEYGIAWIDRPFPSYKLYFTLLDRFGVEIGDDRVISDPGALINSPSLVSSETGWAVAWADNRDDNPEIYFALIDADGNRSGDETRVSDDPGGSGRPSLAWTGSEYAVAWEDDQDGTYEVFLARLDALGDEIGSELQLTDSENNRGNPSLVWNGDGYALAWWDGRHGDSEIYFGRVACCDDADQDGYTECAGDPNDADPAVNPDAQETCDGRDDNGNGAVDEGCDGDCDAAEESSGDVRVTDDSAISILPAAVWNGGGYGVAWEDSRDGSRDIYFAALDPAGGRLDADLAITSDAGNSEDPDLVWTGDGYGVVWKDDRDGNEEVYFARLDASGAKVSGDMRISYDPGASHQPDLAWNGSEFAVVWEDDRNGDWDLYFARVDASGNKIGGDVRVMAGSFGSLEPQLVWTGTEYGMTWRDIRDGNWEVYFTRFDVNGVLLGGDIRITNDTGYSSGLALVWTGSEYAVAWNDARDTEWEIWFARISHLGAKIGDDVRVTDDDAYHSWYPSLTWTGSEYGVAWRDERDGNNEIYFARLSDTGAKLVADMRLTDDVGGSFHPSRPGTATATDWSGTTTGMAMARSTSPRSAAATTRTPTATPSVPATATTGMPASTRTGSSSATAGTTTPTIRSTRAATVCATARRGPPGSLNFSPSRLLRPAGPTSSGTGRVTERSGQTSGGRAGDLLRPPGSGGEVTGGEVRVSARGDR